VKRATWRAALLVAGAAAGAFVAAACSSATTECDCADPAITLAIPSDVAPSVSAVHLTGPACDGVQPTCTNLTGGCSEYRFSATAPGSCNVEIDFATGRTFLTQVNVDRSSQSCCAGFYATPPSSGQISVPGAVPSGTDGGD
jgi:hypothetical protein